ncbi:MAG: hypothetical protein AAFX40_07500 [Cyanobacteria bacterium J06639_1]
MGTFINLSDRDTSYQPVRIGLFIISRDGCTGAIARCDCPYHEGSIAGLEPAVSDLVGFKLLALAIAHG